METNFNIADLFNALRKFERIVRQLRQSAGQDEAEQKRLKAVLALAKADIEELFDQV